MPSETNHAALVEQLTDDAPEWDLSDLYAGAASSEFQRDLREITGIAQAFKARYQGTLRALALSEVAFAEALNQFERIAELTDRVDAFVTLNYYANMADPQCSKTFLDAKETLASAAANLVFFEQEINSISDSIIHRLVKNPLVGRFEPWFRKIGRTKAFQLDLELERFLHEKSVTSEKALVRLFNETIADLRFFVSGHAGPIGLQQALDCLRSPDRAMRESAAAEIAQKLNKRQRVFVLIANTLARDKSITDKLRGFVDVADSRHVANGIEREVVEALVASVRASYSRTSHRYYVMKARWLGLDHLADWDVGAPLPFAPTRRISWLDAKEIVLNSIESFSPQLAVIGDSFFRDKWIDARCRAGKRTGGFSHPTVSSAHPYVFLNYQGTSQDVTTLAHELGHGIHQALAAPHGSLMSEPPLILAETASIFGELLAFRHLLSQATTRQARRAILAEKIERSLNTMNRQVAFYVFERAIHEKRMDGELTGEVINRLWLESMSECLGPAVELTEGYEIFWAYIRHFVNAPFYVYSYAFGEAVANSLYAAYLAGDGKFSNKYIDLLKAGGTTDYKALLATFNLDARGAEFWASGMSVVENLIDELAADEG